VNAALASARVKTEAGGFGVDDGDVADGALTGEMAIGWRLTMY
jgi:hypothetical protein